MNWNVLALNKPGGSSFFLELGSYGLHIVHCSIGIAHSKVGWNFPKIFCAAYFFDKKLSSSPKRVCWRHEKAIFPFKFLKIRWVDTVVVANRFLTVLQPLSLFLEKNWFPGNNFDNQAFSQWDFRPENIIPESTDLQSWTGSRQKWIFN